MIRPRVSAVVFDFDGVLAESNDVKTAAFAAIYREYGDDIANRAVAYHLEHGGISRHIKFRHLHETLLGIHLAESEVGALGEKFSQLVIDAVVASPWVPGAREFIETHFAAIPLFIASGTPDDELRTIVSRRGMTQFFRSTHGTPATKGEIIRAIIEQHAFEPQKVLMVGDAAADFDGARAAGTRFLGRVAAGPSPFPPEIDVVPDLTRLADWL
jgi:HAD superfamily hydrolase (TIGR01549 family)